MAFSQEQVLQMAPDDSSAKSGVQLSNPAKWVALHINERAIWGACQGSGKDPYSTFIDTTNIAFKCSCPSRKFPCKHGIGLLLLYVKKPEGFQRTDDLPSTLSEWLDKRSEKLEQKEEKSAKPVDEAAKAKRIEARTKKVNNGIEALRIWLKDLIRTGIINIPQQQYTFSENITARMVDAQASGLAMLLRKMSNINFYEEGWQYELSKQLSKLYAITEAYQNKEQLTPEWKVELESIIGWAKSKEDILQEIPVRDQWVVCAKILEEENYLITERIWFFGTNTQQFGLFLNFYPKNQLPEHVFAVGTTITADLHYYPSVAKFRVLPGNIIHTTPNSSVNGFQTTEELLETAAHHISIHPFLQPIPAILTNFKLVYSVSKWYLVDMAGQYLIIQNNEMSCWNILSITLGNSFTSFVTYEAGKIEIYAIWYEQKFYPLV